jgi:hypothetical protein
VLQLLRGLTHKHEARPEELARDKHSSLLRKLVNYDRKKFYDIGSTDFTPNMKIAEIDRKSDSREGN